MSDEFDDLVDGLFDQDYRHLDTEDAIHLFGACGYVTAMLGAWEVADAAMAEDEVYAKLRKGGRAMLSAELAKGYEATVKLADDMGECARRYAVRLGQWVDRKLGGPVYLYVLVPCCGTLYPMILGDGKPLRFFDPERDELPTYGGLAPIEEPGN